MRFLQRSYEPQEVSIERNGPVRPESVNHVSPNARHACAKMENGSKMSAVTLEAVSPFFDPGRAWDHVSVTPSFNLFTCAI